MVRFAELIGAPVYQSWMADVNFPWPILKTWATSTTGPQRRLFKEVGRPDRAAGCRCSQRGSCCQTRWSPVIDPRSSTSDDDPWELGKTATDCPIQGGHQTPWES